MNLCENELFNSPSLAMPSGFSPSPRARPSPCRRPPSQAAAASHPALLCCSGAASQPCRSPQPLLLHRPLRRNHPSRSRRCRSGCPRCRFPLQRAPHRQPTPQLLRPRQRSLPRCPLDPRARCPPRPARAADSSCASALVSSPARSTTQPAQGELGARRCTHTTPLMRSSVKVRARGSKTSSTSLLLLGRRFLAAARGRPSGVAVGWIFARSNAAAARFPFPKNPPESPCSSEGHHVAARYN